jgi:hypothetical protein
MAKAVVSGVVVTLLATVCMDAQSGDQSTLGPIARSAARAAADIGSSGGSGRTDAQSPLGDRAWARMRTLIPVGSPIRVTVSGRTLLRGSLRAADEDSITITVAGLDRRVTRADVLQVFVTSGTHRKRHQNIGMAVGMAAGLFAMSRHHCPPQDNICREEAVAALFLPLTLGGVAGGTLVPPGIAWRQIYGRPAS